VERSGELRATLERAFAEPGPSLVAIPIDYRENWLLTTRLGEIGGSLWNRSLGALLAGVLDWDSVLGGKTCRRNSRPATGHERFDPFDPGA
jgi:hypothetical protein